MNQRGVESASGRRWHPDAAAKKRHVRCKTSTISPARCVHDAHPGWRVSSQWARMNLGPIARWIIITASARRRACEEQRPLDGGDVIVDADLASAWGERRFLQAAAPAGESIANSKNRGRLLSGRWRPGRLGRKSSRGVAPAGVCPCFSLRWSGRITLKPYKVRAQQQKSEALGAGH